MLLQRQLSNLTKTAAPYLLECFRHLKIAIASYIFNNNKDMFSLKSIERVMTFKNTQIYSAVMLLDRLPAVYYT